MKASNKVLWGTMGGIFVAVLMAAIAMRVSSCSAFNLFYQSVIGDGNIVTQTRSLQKFDAVSVAFVGKVVVKSGRKFQITVQTDQNLMPYLRTYVTNGVLRIRSKSRASLSPSQRPLFTITTANRLKRFSASGASKIFINNNIDKEQFKLDFSGANEGHFAGKTKNLNINISGVDKVFGKNLVAENTKIGTSGSGYCELNGKTNNLRVDISGTGKLVAKNLIANNAIIKVSGMGKLILHVLHGLDVKIRGLGSIQYYGNPAKIIQNISGAGKIEKMEAK